MNLAVVTRDPLVTAITAGVSFSGTTFTSNFVQNSLLAQKLKDGTD
jgi:hypothetical protein